MTDGSDPSQPDRFTALYQHLMLEVMCSMMDTDGSVEDSEVQKIVHIYDDLVGDELPGEVLTEMVDEARIPHDEVLSHVRQYADRLDDKGREKIVRAAFKISRADSALTTSELQFLLHLGEALGMSHWAVNKVLERVQTE